MKTIKALADRYIPLFSLVHIFTLPGLIALLLLLALPGVASAAPDNLQVSSITPDNCNIYSSDAGCYVSVTGTGFSDTDVFFELIDETGSVVGSFSWDFEICDQTNCRGYLSYLNATPGIYDVKVISGFPGENDYQEILLNDAFGLTSFFVVNDVDPDIYGQTSGVEVTLHGSGFSDLPDDFEVFIIDGTGHEYPAQSVIRNSWYELAAIFDLSVCPLGTYDFKVVKNDQIEILPASFTVEREITVSSITPVIQNQSDNAVLVVSGNGFEPGTSIELVSTSGSRITPRNTDINSLTQLTATFDLRFVPTGSYTVEIKKNYQTALLNDAFEVSAAFGVSSVTPGFALPTEVAGSIQLTGSGFDTTVAVLLVDANGIEYPAQSITIDSPTQLSAVFDFSSIPLGSYDIRLIKNGQVKILSGSFTVTRELVASSITPEKHGNRDGVELVVSGFGFTPGTTVTLVDGTGNEIIPQDVHIDSLSQLTAVFNLSSLDAGLFDVKLSNEHQAALLENGFEVFTALGVSSLSPVYAYSTESAGEIHITGEAFNAGVVVRLVDKDGIEYSPQSVTVNSTEQLTAIFDFRTFPLGRYDIKVSNGAELSMLHESFEVVPSSAKLGTKLILPGRLGRHIVSTLYVEYKNTSTEAIPAPLLRLVSTDEDNSDKPILTLDHSRIRQNYWSSTMPPGTAHSVQFLADGDGDSPGFLEPGESGRMPVYYLGMQRPWNFSDWAVELEIRIVQGDDPESFSWDERKDDMKPESVSQDAWDIIFNNLSESVGETWGDYISTLAENSANLYHSSGRQVSDSGKLMKLEFLQAIGFSPVRDLAGNLDIALQTPGLPLAFARYYKNSISNRYNTGPVGRGWNHNWELSIRKDDDGNALVQYMGSKARFLADSRYTNRYIAPAGSFATLTETNTIFTLSTPQGIQIVFNADGTLNYVKDTNDNQITATYTNSLLTRLTHSNGRFLSLQYDAADMLASITDDTGTLRVDYTAHGSYLSSFQDIFGRSTSYTYHADGAANHALAAILHPDATRTMYDYDSRGRLSELSGDTLPTLTIDYEEPGKVSITNSADNGVHTFFYDENGNVVQYLNPLGKLQKASYTADGQMTSLQLPDGAIWQFQYNKNNLRSLTDPLQGTTAFTYSAYSRLHQMTDARTQKTKYTSDGHGNITTVTSPDSTVRRYEYDQTGSPAGKTNRRGNQVTYSVNDDGQLTRIDYSSGVPVTYTYNEIGQLTGMNDAEGATSIQYTANHLVQRIEYPGGRFLAYTYDNAGRRTSVTDQSGYRVSYNYTADGSLESVANSDGVLVSYTYDDQQRLQTRTLANGVVTTYTYDQAGRLSALVTTNPDGSTLSSYAYQFDFADRRTQMTTADGVWNYTYDLSGQLTRAVFSPTNGAVPARDIIYTYDETGNRIRKTVDGVASDYTRNAMNQYTGDSSFTYSYDADGNLTGKTNGTETWTWTYNDDNRLISSTGPDGTKTYTYNGLGYLSTVVQNGVERHYMIDPFGLGNIMAEYNSAGDAVNRYTYGHGLVAANSDFYTFDGNGNTSELTDTTGQTVNKYLYEPFGGSLYQSETRSNDFEFVGQLGVMNLDNDLLYMRNRFYSPSLGRFMNEDPIGLAGGDVSLYRYVGNDPVNWVDPWGLLTPGQNIAAGMIGTTAGAVTAATPAAVFAPAIAGVAAVSATLYMGGSISEAAWNGVTAAAGIGVLAGKFGKGLFDLGLWAAGPSEAAAAGLFGDYLWDIVMAFPDPWFGLDSDPCP